MRAYVKELPQSCLLVLSATEHGHTLEAALRHALHGGQRHVWVDCRQVAALPTGALRLLCRYARRLWHHGGYLVLCHLPEAARTALATDANQPLAASVLDAHQYGLDCPESPAA